MDKNTFSDYISGSSGKKKIDKTTYDWVSEWVTSLFKSKEIITVIVLLLAGTYVVHFGFFNLHIPPPVQLAAGILLVPIASLVILIFIVRTVSLLLELVNPGKKALDILVGDSITIVLVNGNKVTYRPEEIESILVIYNERGVLIRRKNGTDTYTLPLNPEDIERRLDQITNRTKEVSFFASQEGDIRTVSYGSPTTSNE